MRRNRDILGQKFGRLIAIKDTGKHTNNRNAIWIFKCDCGKLIERNAGNVVSGNTSSCGCLAKEQSTVDITGKRFGKLMAIKPTNQKKGRSVVWECLCDCGEITLVDGRLLRNGNTKSCGCIIREMQSQRAKKNLESMGKEMNKRRSEKHCREKTVIYNLTEKRASHNTSGYKGVSFNKRKNLYEAYITLKRNRRHLGYFATVDEAAKARAKAEEELFDPILEKYGIPKTSA